MVNKYLFPCFLTDPQEYNQAEAFWRSLCMRVLTDHNQSLQWEESTPQYRDGNPIYRMTNREKHKGVRIIQEDPKEHRKWELVSWTDTSGDEYSESGQISELVFTCNLTSEHADVFESLFKFWIEPTTIAERMEEKITEVIGY